MELIKTVDLHKSFGDLHVLTGVNQTIHKGECVSIIGPSGGGKSTFLTLEPLTIVAIIYLCLTFPLSKVVEKFEKKMAKPNSYRNRKKKNGGKI